MDAELWDVNIELRDFTLQVFNNITIMLNKTVWSQLLFINTQVTHEFVYFNMGFHP